MKLPDSEIKMGVASSGGLPHPPGVRLSFKGDYLSRATNITGITVYLLCSTKFSILSFFGLKFFNFVFVIWQPVAA